MALQRSWSICEAKEGPYGTRYRWRWLIVDCCRQHWSPAYFTEYDLAREPFEQATQASTQDGLRSGVTAGTPSRHGRHRKLSITHALLSAVFSANATYRPSGEARGFRDIFSPVEKLYFPIQPDP
jgi:hypothetical protein